MLDILTTEKSYCSDRDCCMEAIKGHTMRAVVLLVAKLWELTKTTRTRPSKCVGSEYENRGLGALNLKSSLEWLLVGVN